MDKEIAQDIKAIRTNVEEINGKIKPCKSNCCCIVLGIFIIVLLALFVLSICFFFNPTASSNAINAQTIVNTIQCEYKKPVAKESSYCDRPCIRKCTNDCNGQVKVETTSYTSTKVFYLVYILGTLSILIVFLLASLKIMTSENVKESKISLVKEMLYKMDCDGMSENITENEKEKFFKTGKQKSNTKRTETKPSYSSYEKVIKHLTDCLSEV